MTVDDHSLKLTKRNTIGGLVASSVPGTFIHFNTIEDYQAADLNAIVRDLAGGILDPKNLKECNRFVVLAFGDLKNYLYHHK